MKCSLAFRMCYEMSTDFHARVLSRSQNKIVLKIEIQLAEFSDKKIIETLGLLSDKVDFQMKKKPNQLK